MSNDSNKTSNKKKNKNTIYNILIAIFSLVFIGSATYLIVYYVSISKSEGMYDELKNSIVYDTNDSNYEETTDESGNVIPPNVDPYIEIGGIRIQRKFQNLYLRNDKFLGWLTVDGTAIDYPVVQTMDNEEYYLRRDYDGNYSTAGTLFIDTSSDITVPSDNILIYGHNMRAGTMFHDLLKFEKEDFYKDHKYIKFDTIYEDGTYEIIAAFKTEVKAVEETGFKYYKFFNAEDEEQFNDYVTNCKKLTPYNIETTATYGDKLITLSTCSYHVDNGRYVVVAKKISGNVN